MSRSDRVRRTIEHTIANGPKDRASSAASVYLYQIKAAQAHGVFEPFDADQAALNDWLTEQQAGRRLCAFAWDALMRSQPRKPTDKA